MRTQSHRIGFDRPASIQRKPLTSAIEGGTPAVGA
jgi:hypothetical protein